ncbi:MAG: DUF4286 family protein [Pseudorhodoplanes sp.]
MHSDAKALYIVGMDIASEMEEEFNRWLDQEHIPERLAVEGFLSAKRFKNAGGSPRYFVVYELSGLDVLNAKEYLHLLSGGRSEWTVRLMPYMSNIQKFQLGELP